MASHFCLAKTVAVANSFQKNKDDLKIMKFTVMMIQQHV